MEHLPLGLLVLAGLFVLAVAILLLIEFTVVRRPKPLVLPNARRASAEPGPWDQIETG